MRASLRESGCTEVRGRWRRYPGRPVHPGVIDTPIWMKIPASLGAPNELVKAGVPVVKAGQAQDIANGVLFLASYASSYIGVARAGICRRRGQVSVGTTTLFATRFEVPATLARAYLSNGAHPIALRRRGV